MLHGWTDASAARFGGAEPLSATIRRFIPLAAFGGALILAHAAFDAAPTVVAEREGGMGLGSALIVAQVFGVAGIGAGAIAAASLVDRGRASTAAVAGALTLYVGMTALGTAPSGALAWVTVAYGLGGAGLGAVATCAFSIAAGLDPRPRVAAIVLLLLAPIAARGLAGSRALLPEVGPAALIVSGAMAVALAVLAVRGSAGGRAGAGGGAHQRRGAERPVHGRAVIAGGALVTLGIVAVLAGADPSRLSATMLAGPLGVDLAALDGVRVALGVAGLAMVAGGSAVLVARTGAGRVIAVAAAATAFVVVAAAGLAALLSLAGSPGGVPQPSPAIGLAGLAATVIGLALGAWWLAGGGASRPVAVAGGLILVAAAAVGLLGTQVMGPDGAGAVPLLAASSAGFGGGLAAPALRVVLAAVAVPHRGLAAALGVAGAAAGTVLGSMVGSAAGRASTGGADQGLPVGAVLLLFAAAVGALGLAGLLPGSSVSLARSADRPQDG